MPQASDELRAKFPGSCDEARDVLGLDNKPSLAARWLDINGYIYATHRSSLDTMTEREGDAIDYLCDEWDYCFTREVR